MGFFRSTDKNKFRFFAADCAESVLHLFEKRYPNDSRPRKAIEAARATAYATAAAYAADAAYAAAAARKSEELKQIEFMKRYA